MRIDYNELNKAINSLGFKIIASGSSGSKLQMIGLEDPKSTIKLTLTYHDPFVIVDYYEGVYSVDDLCETLKRIQEIIVIQVINKQ